MDEHHDSITTHRLGRYLTRRRSLGGLWVLAALLGIAPADLPGDDVVAKKGKGKGNGKGKRCAQKKKHCTTPPPAPLPPAISAPAGCPSGQKACGGGCIPSNQCCTNADCAGGRTCQNTICACPATSLTCGAACCSAPVGLRVTRITCGIAPDPICLCESRAADVCAAGCTSDRPFTLNCANPDRELLSELCLEAGCNPPMEPTPPPPR